MANLSYIESITKNPPSNSLYNWVKQNPQKNISEFNNDKVPPTLYIRADRFQKFFGQYKGDGVLFFFDDLIHPLSEVSLDFYHYGHYYPVDFIRLFNYLYSFASSFSIKSRGALAVFLLDCPALAVPLYRYRKNFDPKAFTNMIEKMYVFNSFNEYIKDDDAKKQITRFIWEAILSQKITLNVCDNKVFLHLYYGYTYTAIQRFFLLSNSRAAIKAHITNAYETYKETCLLLNRWGENNYTRNSGTNRIIPQMGSIKAMERFHDLSSEEMLEQQRALDTCKYIWGNLSEKIKEVSPEWYLPECTTEIRFRGAQHHNCVGGYADRHYNPVDVKNKFKMLLLFTDFCEAEVHLSFGECIVEGKAFLGCINVMIQQAKTSYNKDISKENLLELKKLVKVFINLPAEDFNPVCVEKEKEKSGTGDVIMPAEDE